MPQSSFLQLLNIILVLIIKVTVQGFLMNIHEIFIFIFLAQIRITMKLQFITMKVYCNVDSIIAN